MIIYLNELYDFFRCRKPKLKEIKENEGVYKNRPTRNNLKAIMGVLTKANKRKESREEIEIRQISGNPVVKFKQNLVYSKFLSNDGKKSTNNLDEGTSEEAFTSTETNIKQFQ